MKKIRALLFLLFLIYWGCNPSHISEIKKNEKPIEYKVPPRSRFNVPSLLTMDIENIEKILGKPINDWKPTKYQKAVGVNLSSNKLWKIKSTSIDVEYKNGHVISIFVSDSEEDLSAGEMVIRGGIHPFSKDYSIKYKQWINPKYAKEMKASQIAGIEVKPI